MKTKNRLNPNPASRPTLRALQGNGILHRQKIGLRNIIRAQTGAVEPFGYDIGGIYQFIQQEPSLSNFRQSCSRREGGPVSYAGGRAEICATTNVGGNYGVDLSRRYPVNSLAMELLTQPCTKRSWYEPIPPIYGDAVLITDKRFHWVFSRHQVPDDEIKDFDTLLTSPRTVHTGWHGTSILFHEEPTQADIFTIKLAWQ